MKGNGISKKLYSKCFVCNKTGYQANNCRKRGQFGKFKEIRIIQAIITEGEYLKQIFEYEKSQNYQLQYEQFAHGLKHM